MLYSILKKKKKEKKGKTNTYYFHLFLIYSILF